jgi:hypothetical protein
MAEDVDPDDTGETSLTAPLVMDVLFQPPGKWVHAQASTPITYTIMRVDMKPSPVGILWAAEHAAGFIPAKSAGELGDFFQDKWDQRVLGSRVAWGDDPTGEWVPIEWLKYWWDTSNQVVQHEGLLHGIFGDLRDLMARS